MKQSTLKTDILILGAGIGGYETFRTLTKLLKRNGLKKTITLIDKNNYFTFAPMLHEVAVGSVEPHHTAIALRDLVYKTPHRFIKTTIKKIHPEKQLVDTASGMIAYDYCVVALGSGVNFFGVPGAEKYSHSVRTLVDAIRLHNNFLQLLEACGDTPLNIVIVGGGWTGVEVAGQLADFMQKEGKKLYRDKSMCISIVQSETNLLPQLPPKVQKRVTERLQRFGIKIYTETQATEVKADAVVLSTKKILPSDITIWTAGVHNIADCHLDTPHCEKQRIPTTLTLQHPSFPSLYGVGDNALIFNPHNPVACPQLGEAAHKEGKYVAHHIVKTMRGKKHIAPFVFRSAGSLIPVGDWWGAVIIGNFVFFGRLAWWIRRTVYLLFIPGLLRKLRIVIDWTLHSFGFRHTISIEDTEWK